MTVTDEDGREVEMVAGGAPAPWWSWVVAGAILAIVVGTAWAIVTDARADRAASPWTYLGSPPSSAGGAYVWTLCDGPTRLYLTTGADGFPAGPAVAVPFEQGSGCGR